jgi:hypothetical protein
MRRLIVLLAGLSLILAGCSSDPTASEEYQELEQQLADTSRELADVTAERDALAATASAPSERHDKALDNQEAVEDILHNPESYGSEEEVVELLATYATEDAVMDDAVFGAAPIMTAWRETLYGGAMDAEIENYYRWLSEDGSQGGILWIWRGTNLAGNPFELAGISLNEYDEDGLLTYSYVVYPHPDEYVNEAIVGDGTAQSPDETMSEENTSDDVFVFGEDDLCELVTEDEVAEYARDAYEAVGEEWNGTATLTREHWFEDPIEYECEWSLSGSDGLIYVYTEPASRSGGQTIAYAELSESHIPMSGTVVEHPEFDDDVMIQNHAFGRYGFWVPESEGQMVLSVSLGRDVELEDYGWEVPLFVVANRFLDEMNWTP